MDWLDKTSQRGIMLPRGLLGPAQTAPNFTRFLFGVLPQGSLLAATIVEDSRD